MNYQIRKKEIKDIEAQNLKFVKKIYTIDPHIKAQEHMEAY